MLAARYSKEWVQAATDNVDGVVGSRVSSRLKIFTPGAELVDLYVAEVCRAYDVPFSSPLQNKSKELERMKPNSESVKTVAAAGHRLNGDLNPFVADMPLPVEAPPLDPKAVPAIRSDETISKTTRNMATNSGEINETLSLKEQDRKEYDELEARFAALKKR